MATLGSEVPHSCDPTSRNATPLYDLAGLVGHLDIVNFFISDQNYDPNMPEGHHVTMHLRRMCTSHDHTD